MRFYAFGNMYLSSIQQGIQAAHVIGNMAVKYTKNSMFHTWARDHKTIILLNGGMGLNLAMLVNHLQDDDNPYEWAYFCESTDALDGALTSVGIILPEEVYEQAAEMRKRDQLFDIQQVSMWERELYRIMNSCRMAH